MTDFVMQVRSGRGTGVARVAQQLAALDVIADRDIDAVHVAIHGYQTLTMVQEYGLPVEEVVPHFHDGPIRGCPYGRADVIGNIQTIMWPSRLVVEVPAQTEWTCKATFHR